MDKVRIAKMANKIAKEVDDEALANVDQAIDTMIASAIVDENQLRYDLNNCSRRYTGQGKDHPGLYRKGLFVKRDEIHWIRKDRTLLEGETLEVLAGIRYRQKLEKATLYQTGSGMFVIFDSPQSAITQGQFVAWYHDNECLGSGVIS